MNKELKAALEKAGLSEEQIAGIDQSMKDGKLFITNEEHIEDRYEKAKTQKENVEAELQEANSLIDDLKKSKDSSEELQKQIADFETKVEELQGQNAAQAKQNAIDVSLLKSGAKNPKTVQALLDLEKIELKDDGVHGIEDQLEAIKKDEAYLFQNDGDDDRPNIVNSEDPNGSNQNDEDPFDEVAKRY